MYFLGEMDKTSKEKLSLIEWISECRPKSTLTKYKSITDEYLKYAQSKELRPELDVTVCSFMRYAVTDRRNWAEPLFVN